MIEDITAKTDAENDVGSLKELKYIWTHEGIEVLEALAEARDALERAKGWALGQTYDAELVREPSSPSSSYDTELVRELALEVGEDGNLSNEGRHQNTSPEPPLDIDRSLAELRRRAEKEKTIFTSGGAVFILPGSPEKSKPAWVKYNYSSSTGWEQRNPNFREALVSVIPADIMTLECAAKRKDARSHGKHSIDGSASMAPAVRQKHFFDGTTSFTPSSRQKNQDKIDGHKEASVEYDLPKSRSSPQKSIGSPKAVTQYNAAARIWKQSGGLGSTASSPALLENASPNSSSLPSDPYNRWPFPEQHAHQRAEAWRSANLQRRPVHEGSMSKQTTRGPCVLNASRETARPTRKPFSYVPFDAQDIDPYDKWRWPWNDRCPLDGSPLSNLAAMETPETDPLSYTECQQQLSESPSPKLQAKKASSFNVADPHFNPKGPGWSFGRASRLGRHR